jgi:hypothetical protein
MRTNMNGNIVDAWSIGSDIKILSLNYLKVQPYFEFTQFWFSPNSVILHTNSNIEYKSIAI